MEFTHVFFFFFQAEDGIRDGRVTGVQTCALPILRGIPVNGDGVAWFNGCEVLDHAALAELIARGERAGMTVLLSTTSEPAAASLAADVNVAAIHRLADPVAAGQLAAALAGPRLAARK